MKGWRLRLSPEEFIIIEKLTNGVNNINSRMNVLQGSLGVLDTHD